MKFADRCKFNAAGTSAATITVAAAVLGFRTLAQVISESASDPLGIKVGDTNVPFVVDDGAGNEEFGFYTVTSTTVLTRTSVLQSSAGGTNPATFTGAVLSVFNSMPASFASKLLIAITDVLGNTVGIQDPKGNPINLIARLLANANTPASPAVEKTFKVIDVIRVTNNTGDSYPDRQVYAEGKRKSITFKNPVTNTVSFEIGSRKADNIQNPNPPTWTGLVIAPGQECVVFFDDSQYWLRQSATTTTVDQFMIIEREVRV